MIENLVVKITELPIIASLYYDRINLLLYQEDRI